MTIVLNQCNNELIETLFAREDQRAKHPLNHSCLY